MTALSLRRRRVLGGCFGAIAVLVASANAAEVTRVGPYTFHSSFWINLHETLMLFASARTPPDLPGLSDEERTAWNAAVAVYEKTSTGSVITFVPAMSIMHDVLSQVGDDIATPAIRPPLGTALVQAAPIYRRHFWPSDDRANRFWIGYAAAMVRDAGEELARKHESVYGATWPKLVRVDAAAYAEPFGAYTMFGQLAGVHVTIATRLPANAGLAALEVVMHETSHAVIGPRRGRVADAIGKEAEKRGIPPPLDLWHAILFATSSELTRQALEDRGAAGYQPFAQKMFERVWPRYREPIETHWLPYVKGKGTLEEAIAKIVEAAPAPR